MNKDNLILAGDIGGTKTYMGLFKSEGPSLTPLTIEKLVNTDFESISALILSFIDDNGGLSDLGITDAAFGVACPVEGNRCSLTNTPWVIDGEVIAGILKLPEVSLLNDLAATGWGIETLGSDDIKVINKGLKRHGNAALIAAGTGLGETILFNSNGQRRPSATEGGHTDFAPSTPLEMELLGHLMRRFGHVSYERLLSGDGLGNIYAFLLNKDGESLSKAEQELFDNHGGGEIVFKMAREKAHPLAVEAINIFVSIYGAEAGNLALKSMSTGGLYIGGGIAPKIFTEEEEKIFMEAFVKKGRFRELLTEMPVYLIKNDKTGLLGAAKYVSTFF
ncbi:MAG: glucokinase [Thermodesulfobacteriota bacterium]